MATPDNQYLRKNIIFFIMITFFAMVVFQLFNMQILQNTRYQIKSEDNSIKRESVDAPRGVFFDRNLVRLVSNIPSYSLKVKSSEFDYDNAVIMEDLLQIDSGYVTKEVNKIDSYSRYLWRKIYRDAGYPFIAWLEENRNYLPGIDYSIDLKRNYLNVINGAHMFGYVKEISGAQYRKERDIYNLGDMVGSAGLEKQYEEYLRGKKGYNYFIVDSRLRKIRRYREGIEDVPYVKGNDLVLTIDANTQHTAEELMKEHSGAVVAIEPKTGEILALVSAPNYDPSYFDGTISPEHWNSLINNKKKPLFNRATMSIYPPGSTVKMLESIISLEEGIWPANKSIRCAGGYQFGNRFFRCTHVHGKTDMRQSIEHSCNTYYYQLALEIGLERWAKYMRMFGFGVKTDIDIPEESKGIVPDTDYYNRVYKKGWTRGVLLSLGIGQGEFSVTPLQLARYTALLANYGKTYQPHLVRGYLDSETNMYVPLEFDEFNVDIKRSSFDVIREGMLDVVHGDGTAKWIRVPGYKMAGKTGTAQNPHGEDHSIFIAFAPYDDPQIAIAVFVENVGYGSTYAAPIAAKVIDAYLNKTVTNIKPDTTKSKNDTTLVTRLGN